MCQPIDSNHQKQRGKTVRIGFDARVLIHSGIGVYAYNLIESLLECAPDDDFVCFVDPKTQSLLPEKAKAEAAVINVGVVSLSLRQHVVFPATSRTQDLDIYHYPHFDMPLFQPYPSVLTIHDLHPMLIPGYTSALKRLYFKWIATLNARRARAVIAVSENTREIVSEYLGVPSEKIMVVYNGVAEQYRVIEDSILINRACEKYGLPPGFVLFVGNHKPHKNLERLLEAYSNVDAGLQEKHPLVLAGKGSDAEDTALRAKIAQLGLMDNVRLVGFVSNEDLPLLYNAAIAFVFPSIYEGFGLPVVEAMRCGVPVITSDTSSLKEIGQPAARMVDPYNVDDLSAALMQVLSDPALRGEMRYSGLKWASTFTWRQAAEQTLSVYRMAIR